MTDVEEVQFHTIEDLSEWLDECLVLLTNTWVNADSFDDPHALAVLLSKVADVKRSAAEVYVRVESSLMSCAGEKEFEVPNLGLISIKKKIQRSNWNNQELWTDVVKAARASSDEPLVVLEQCVRPSWRVTPLRALGIDPDEYCQTTDDGWSVRLPSKPLTDQEFERF